MWRMTQENTIAEPDELGQRKAEERHSQESRTKTATGGRDKLPGTAVEQLPRSAKTTTRQHDGIQNSDQINNESKDVRRHRPGDIENSQHKADQKQPPHHTPGNV